ncbi:MAG: hypothetical protein Kow0047_12310 [Anaerolineae bacterium]
MKSLIRAHAPGLLVWLAFLVLNLTYNLSTPVFEAPDELEHFEYVRHVILTGTLPDLRGGLGAWAQEGTQPPLYYVTAAGFLRLLGVQVPDDPIPVNPHAAIGLPDSAGNKNRVVHSLDERFPFQGLARVVHLTRLTSLLWGSVGLFGCYALAAQLTGRKDVAALSMAWVAFLPQFAFITAAVSNDAVVMGTVSCLLAAAWWVTTQPPMGRRGALLGVLAGMAALSKLNGLLAAAWVGFFIAARWLRQGDRKGALWATGAYALVATAVGGWWYARNLWLYGDWSGIQPMLDVIGRYKTPLTAMEVLGQAGSVWRSFWGVFGWFNVEMPEPVYYVLTAVSSLIALGLVARLRRGPGSGTWWEPLWLIGWIVVIGLGLANWMRLTPAAQGRLIFPALPALAALGAWALGSWPRPWRRLLGGGLALLLLATSLVAPFSWIRPAYAAPPLMESLPSDAEPTEIRYGDAVRLIGVAVDRKAAFPGEAIQVTLYWRTEAALLENYSVFVHVVGGDGLIIAQDDSYPAQGAWATSLWPVGSIVPDTHVIRLPVTTFAPEQVELHVGVYHLSTGERLRTDPPADRDSVPVASVQIRSRPGEVPNPVCVAFGGDLTLIGYEMEKRVLPARDAIRMDLYWRVDRIPERTYTTFAQVVSVEDDTIWGQRDTQPQPQDGEWRVGQIIKDHKEFQVDARTPPGIYRLLVGMYDAYSLDLIEPVPVPGCVAENPVMLTRVRVMPRVR